MIAVAALAILSQAGPAAVPPPPDQVSADCVAPSYADDMAVCGDAGLRELDRRMVAALPAAGPAARLRTDYAIEPQRDWFRRSRSCAAQHAQLACLRAAYRERIAVLGAAGRAPPPGERWQACRKGTDRVAFVDGGIVVLRRGDRTYLASSATELSAWRPWLAAVLDGVPDRSPKRVTFRWLDGAKADCRLPRSAARKREGEA